MRNINTQGTINPDSETHFAVLTQIDEKQYPQVHDFYELTFLTDGDMNFILNDTTYKLSRGDLLLIRPRDIHSKVSVGLCSHINLAFPKKTIVSLFSYLYDTTPDEIIDMKQVPVCHLSSYETSYLQNKLMRLNTIPVAAAQEIKSCLRTILAEIISQYIMKEVRKFQSSNVESTLPIWLKQALYQLEYLDDYSDCVHFLSEVTKKTPEHICRLFRKYLNTTPTIYVNLLRLNYAANLLIYSDKKIIDIALESGFQSLSYFHHLFKREFNVTPLQYRNNLQIL